jgi:amidase
VKIFIFYFSRKRILLLSSAYVAQGDPSGSSSGSAIATSAGLCAAAIGTETAGSIIMPSSRASIVGLKPTVGLTSRSGIIPVSHDHDTVGPMGRTVEDVALLLGKKIDLMLIIKTNLFFFFI